MTAKKLRAVCAVMKDYGIPYIKIDNCEIGFSPTDSPKVGRSDPKVEQIEIPEELKHRVEELKSVMQLGDDELLNRMFPETDVDSAVE